MLKAGRRFNLFRAQDSGLTSGKEQRTVNAVRGTTHNVYPMMASLIPLVRALGLVAAANILARRKLGFARAIAVRLGPGKEQAKLRPCDSDLFVASQIFGTREYDSMVARTWDTHLFSFLRHIPPLRSLRLKLSRKHMRCLKQMFRTIQTSALGSRLFGPTTEALV